MSVNMKSTKQEIMDAYTEVKRKLDAISMAKDDPAAIEKKNNQYRILASADEIVDQNILAPEVIQKYKNLCTAIEIKEKQLSDLYNIEAEENSLVALINAHKDKEVELKAKYVDLEASLDKEYKGKLDALKEEIAALKAEKEMVLEETRKANDELKAALQVERAREKEQYDYDLQRERKLANDKWEDERNTRERELAAKEADVESRLAAVVEREQELAELREKVSNIPALLEEAKAEGKADGKKEADKSHVFEVRAINTKNEYEQKALNDQIDRLNNDLSMLRSTNAEIQMKLDMAYTQMKDLAADTVKSNGSIKIIGGDNSNKAVSK